MQCPVQDLLLPKIEHVPLVLIHCSCFCVCLFHLLTQQHLRTIQAYDSGTIWELEIVLNTWNNKTLDPPASAMYSEPSYDLSLIRPWLNFHSNIRVNSLCWYENGSFDRWPNLKQDLGLFISTVCLRARFYPWELEFTWLRPASVWVQNRRHALLTLWATAENYRRSDSYFVLNFLSHGPCGQLNPGFSGNSHLLSVMGISIHLMGNSKGNFFSPL